MIYADIDGKSCYLYRLELEGFFYYVSDSSVMVEERKNLTSEEKKKVLLDFIGSESEVYTLSCYTQDYLLSLGIKAEMLNNLLGSTSCDIYGLYCGRFGTPSGMTKTGMLTRLVLDAVWKPRGRNCMLFDCSYDKGMFCFDFTWFSMTPDGYIKQLGHCRRKITDDEYAYCSISEMFYSIRQEITGIGLSESSFIGYSLWRDDSVPVMLQEIHGVDMPDYMCQSECICNILHEMCMLKCISDAQLFDCLSSSVYLTGMEWDTEHAVSALSCMSKKQGCHLEPDGMAYRKPLYVDFTTKTPYEDIAGYASYGFVLDCEGKSDGGCSEIGAVLYGHYGSKIVKLKEYHSSENGLPSVLKEMAYDYQKCTRRRGTAPVIVYGEMDKSFIKISLLDMNEARLFKQVDRNFTFIDTRQFIENVMNDCGIQARNFKLGTVAETLGVKKKTPAHNALNDAGTLFNVLSGLLMVSGRFVL